ncbi:MAG: hypothetical protein AB7R89_23065 [Dehalococcoidia bacterium]
MPCSYAHRLVFILIVVIDADLAAPQRRAIMPAHTPGAIGVVGLTALPAAEEVVTLAPAGT